MEIICPQCGFSRNLPEEKLPAGRVVAKCPRCKCRFRFSVAEGAGEILPPKAWQTADQADPPQEEIRRTANEAYEREARRFEPESAEEEPAPGHNPWATAPGKAGWPGSFYQTVIRVMFQAPAFFKNLYPKADLLRPLSFFIIISLFQTIVEQVWSKVFFKVLEPEAARDAQLARLLELLSSTNGILTGLFRMGVLVLQLYAFSLLMYLVYRIVARECATFPLVFQVLAYSSAPWLLCIIPGVGSLAGTLWGIGCAAIGCRYAMGLNWAQTFLGFLPILFILLPLLSQLASLQ